MFRKRPAQDLKRTRRIGQHQHTPRPVIIDDVMAMDAPAPDPLQQLKPGEGGALASLAVAASLILGGFRRKRSLVDSLAAAPVYFPDDRDEREEELDTAMRDMYQQEADAIREKARRPLGRAPLPRSTCVKPSRLALRMKSKKLRRRHRLGEFAPQRHTLVGAWI